MGIADFSANPQIFPQMRIFRTQIDHTPHRWLGLFSGNIHNAEHRRPRHGVGMVSDEPAVVPFDHRGGGIVLRRDDSDWDVGQQRANDT